MKGISLLGKFLFLSLVVFISHHEAIAQDIYLTPLSRFSAAPDKVTSISFSPDTKLISVLSGRNEVLVWRIEDQKKMRGFTSKSPIVLHAFYDNDKIAILDKSGRLIKYDFTSNSELSLPLSPNVKQACLDPTRQYIASFVKENIIELFDLRAGMTAGRIAVNSTVKEVGYLGMNTSSKPSRNRSVPLFDPEECMTELEFAYAELLSLNSRRNF